MRNNCPNEFPIPGASEKLLLGSNRFAAGYLFRFGIAGALKKAVMARNTVFVRMIRLSAALLLLGTLRPLAIGAEMTVMRTNWNERWITNVVEVRMPVNRFVNQYRTNWVEQIRTRVVNMYATNWTLRTLTNRVAVNAVVTNYTETYKTNCQTVQVTRIVPV